MKRSLVMSIILIMCLQAMDAPLKPLESQEIPADIQIKYSQERDRFKSYDLNNPENKFLPLMHAQFEKNEHNLFPYLGYLNIFVNLLLAQHFLLNTAADIYYLNHEITKVREKEKSLTIQLGGVVDPSNPTQSIIKVPNIDNLNEVIAHTSILNKTKEILTPEELQVVFNWLFDDRFDSWMKLLSEHRLLLNILQPLQKLRSTKRHTLDRQLNEIDASLNKQLFTPPQLIQKNMHPMQSLSEANQKAYKRFINYQKKDIKRETTFNSMMEDNYNEIAAEGHLYLYTHAWYEQLYKIVRAEMKAVITQLMKLEPKKIKEISSLATNSFTNDFPEKVLPLELPAFVNPALSIALPNLDKERAQAKKVWEEEQKHIEEERKRNNKIKQTADGSSYVLEYQDTPTSITIHNTKNNTQEIIFKHEHPNEIEKKEIKIFPINYTNWVKEWFSNPEHAIETHGYHDVTSSKYRAGEPTWKPIVLHTFSPLVDEYIKQWGRVTTIKNRRNPAQEDVLITIPGKMIYPPGSKPQEEAGVFAYIIDSKNGQWYHRMFTVGELSELTKNLFQKGYFAPEMTGYYDVFFPALPSRKK